MIDNIIQTALDSAGIPAERDYRKEADIPQYIIWNYRQSIGLEFADDDAYIIEHTVQIDIMSKGNYNTVIDDVISALYDAGFNISPSIESSDYQNDIGYYSRTITAIYTEYKE